MSSRQRFGTMLSRTTLVFALGVAATPGVATGQHYIPMPSMPLPRPSPYYAELTRQLITQHQTLNRIGPTGQTARERAGAARIRAQRASLQFVETAGFSIADHLLTLVPPGRQGDPLRMLIREQAALMRTSYQAEMRSVGANPLDVVDVLAHAFRIAFRIEAGRPVPGAYLTKNAQLIRNQLLNSPAFQGLGDLERQQVAEEIGVRAAYADAQSRNDSAPAREAAHHQAQVILASVYGVVPSRQFLDSIRQ